MQKQKENQFLDKFRLLNSQEYTEEIIWSLSDSSEYEETSVNEKFNNLTNRARILKRKRKRKAPKNIANLSITVLDTSKDSKDLQSGEKSPILVTKTQTRSICPSPVLVPTQPVNRAKSPVLPSKRQYRSPILVLKSFSPKNVGGSKKRLFSPTSNNFHTNSSVLNNNIAIKTEVLSEIDSECGIEDNLTCPVIKINRLKEENTATAKLELAKRIKSYFDCHFSSDSSQNSQPISDIQTPKSSTKNSDEIIISCQTTSNESFTKKSIKENLSDQSAENSFYTFNKTKKVRYKKNGLAHRLDNLLRKQNTSLSLWHHERYLEANSNFVIPKREHSMFRIQKVHYQYGCYLIEAVDLNLDLYLILINSCYVTNAILCDVIIKVYEPFKIIQYNCNSKLLINVCRFEFSEFKSK